MARASCSRMPEYREYRDGTRTLSDLCPYSMPWKVTLGGESPREIEGMLVTCNFFDVLELRPTIGIGFTNAHCDSPGAPPAVVLSHAAMDEHIRRRPRHHPADHHVERTVGCGRRRRTRGIRWTRAHKSGVLRVDVARAGQLDAVPILLDFQGTPNLVG